MTAGRSWLILSAGLSKERLFHLGQHRPAGAATGAAVAAAPKRSGALRAFPMRLVREKPLGLVGGLIVLGFFLVGIFADVLAPGGYMGMDLGNRLLGPSREFPLGTDQFGRDELSRIIHGARISMIVGLSALAVGLCIAVALGTVSGYFGGPLDLALQRFADAWLTFPQLFIILAIMTIIGQGLLPMIIVLGAFSGLGNIRVVRGVVLAIRESPYVEAARATGCSTLRVLVRHVLPQIWGPVVVVFTVGLGGIILQESTISFLGFGIPPPPPSWGSMLSMEGRIYMEEVPLLAFWPGLCLAIVVYGINMFGDALRDLLDPRLRGAGRIDAGKRPVGKAAPK